MWVLDEYFSTSFYSLIIFYGQKNHIVSQTSVIIQNYLLAQEIQQNRKWKS